MLQKLIETDKHDTTSFILRLVLAGVILPHGLQKLTGALGGYGFENTMNYFTGTVGVPWTLGFLVILIESVGMILLAAGFASRILALLLAITMVGAASLHIENEFFMNWFNNQPGEGIEFFILTCAMAIYTMIKGAGQFSVDSFLSTRSAAEPITEKV